MRAGKLGLGLALLASCAGEPAATHAKPPEVRVAQVGALATNDIVEATGTVALRRETSLGFTSAGRIATLRVNEGDAVRAGQLLAALDTTTVAADLSSARAERERAAAEYARSATLLAKGWVTRLRVDNAKATLGAADARVRATGFQVNSATIVASGAGTILARLAEPGQVMAAGTPVLVLGESASGYVLRLPLADRDASRIRLGAPATVSLGAGEVLTGQVTEIAGRADRLTGTFAVELGLPAYPQLRSGRIATARIVGNGAGPDALAVPSTAVFAPRAGEGFVYVVDPKTSKLSLRKVALAETGDAGIRVTSGIRRGEWVAVSGIDRLAPGMKIAPIRLPR